MPTDLQELERLLAEATPGPWAFNSYSTVLSAPRVQEYEIDDTVETNVCVVPREGRGDLGTPQGQKDGDLIAAMRNALPELIAELRELRADRERLVKAAGEVLYRIKGDPRMEGGAYYRIAPATHPDTHKAIIGLQAAIDAARVPLLAEERKTNDSK